MNETTLKSQPHVLASRNFRLLWLGQAISTFGDKFTEIAIPVFVLNLTGSALQLGLAFLVQTIAALLFGFLAGTLTDRWDRRRTMIWADLIRAGIISAILGLALLPWSAAPRLVALYVLAFAAAAVKQFFLPAKIAAIPDTVDESQLMAANSLDQSTMTLVGFLGFGAAGALIESVGSTVAFWIDAGTFVLSAVFIALMRLEKSELEGDVLKSVWEDMKAGLEQVKVVPILRGTVILSILAPLALGATQPLLLLFSREILKAGDFGFGLLEGIFAIGIAFGAFVLGKVAKDFPRGRLLALGVIGMGVGQVVAVILPLMLQNRVESSVVLMSVSLPFFFLGAASNAAVFIGIRTIVQEASPRAMIGRIFGVITVASSTAIASGAALAGLADTIGVGSIILFWGGFLIFVGLAAFMWKAFEKA
jgi:MFS family permease